MNKILIANRGEIAVRVIRTAQSLGYGTVAVFSDADADAPHVALADQAVRLGPAEAAESYLNTERLLEAARETGADAIHPGYGFLSENADFARLVTNAGLTWIGPPPDAMEVMGNKAAAKAAIADSKVPTIPGYFGEDQSDAAFAKAAEQIGFPVMVKAAAGGGGRGMRLVNKPDDLTAALASARSESLKAFSSDELLLEKAIVNPRHVEFQVFADQHGNTVHLGERDCSIQRRHQKVVEEAPSPAVSPELREKMGQAAVAAAEAVSYTNAGTVEFLLDENDDFYFIEMNTRLQVEHPVTELISGFDLVAWQLQVAEGGRLPATQQDISLQGHAIEVRLYAESPDNDFLPSTGTVLHWNPPTGDGVRVDHGLQSGQQITPFYDAMIAKVITWGDIREIAQRRLSRALLNTEVLGVDTNRRFLRKTIQHPVFVSGEATTAFIEQTASDAPESDNSSLSLLAAAVLYQTSRQQYSEQLTALGSHSTTYRLQADSPDRITQVEATGDRLRITCDDCTAEIRVLACEDHRLQFEMNNVRDTATWAFGADHCLWIQHGEDCASFTDTLLAPADSADGHGSGKIVAPMPGSVLRVDVAAGTVVEKGQPLLVLEAMKMEQTIEADLPGTVSEVLVETGQQVTPRQLIIVIEPAEES